MKKNLQRMLEALRSKNPTRAAELSLKFAMASEADYSALNDEIVTALVDQSAAGTTAAITAEAAASTLAEAHRIQSRSRIDTKLSVSKLPVPAQSLVREHLEARP